jgi:transposase-like protein
MFRKTFFTIAFGKEVRLQVTLVELRNAVPSWLPSPVLVFIAYANFGMSMRSIARELGVEPSTISRGIRRFKHRLNDPLVADGLSRITVQVKRDLMRSKSTSENGSNSGIVNVLFGEDRLTKVGLKPLGSCYYRSSYYGVVSRPMKQTSSFDEKTGQPLKSLARLRNRSGVLFLGASLIDAGTMLREDYEQEILASGVSVEANQHAAEWIKSPEKLEAKSLEGLDTPFFNAIRYLGSELSAVALQCCCCSQRLQSLELEKEWPARSGKIVLRVALLQLAQYYSRGNRARTQ